MNLSSNASIFSVCLFGRLSTTCEKSATFIQPDPNAPAATNTNANGSIMQQPAGTSTQPGHEGHNHN